MKTFSYQPFRTQRAVGSSQSGVAAVELAFVVGLLLLMAAATFEFGRAFWYYNALAKATRDGARVMSMAPVDSLASSVTTATTIVVNAANGANLVPILIDGNVEITCDNNPCENGDVPTNVEVRIDGYEIDIGAMFPFVSPMNPTTISFSAVSLAPHTTMRYMN